MSPSPPKRTVTSYALASMVVLAATAVGRALVGTLQLPNAVLVYVLGIVAVAIRLGRGPAIFAALLSVLAFDFLFVPPLYTLVVADAQYLLTFAMMFVVAIVVSTLSQRAEQAQVARLEAEREQMRNALLSSVSHDLRTPLAVITGTATTLRDERIDPAMRRDLTESIVSEAERLERLVRNLLDMTRLEAGAALPKKEWQPVEETVGAALAQVDRQLGDRRVTTDLEPDLLAPYDSMLVQQVLVNLLENAAKYTPEHSPIDITAKHGAGVVEICVADRGPGLPAGDEQKVFEKFHRATDGKGGVGLGLTICKAIVAAHGGTTWATNRQGGGSELHFTLPASGEPPSMDVPRAEGSAS